MSQLVEVQLLDHSILLSCDESTTVADITAAALAEYRSFNLKKCPQKVLYTRDGAGRVLSGSLKLIQNKIDTKLEVVVADYNGKDSVSPKETVVLYREWQIWTVNLLKENVYALSIHEVPPRPEEATLVLLYELCESPSDAVQLLCTKVLQILLTKFPQKGLVMEAAQQICKLFSSTTHAEVAVACLESFKGLSPLQAKVFNSAQYVKDMFDLQSALSRFPPDQQGVIFSAFEQIATILGDSELNNVLHKKNVSLVAEEEVDNTRQQASFLEDGQAERKPESDTNDSAQSPESANQAAELPVPPRGNSKGSPSSNIPAEPVVAPQLPKRINLKRLESLLASGDAKVRLYALEKLLKLLTIAARGHRKNKVAQTASDAAAAPLPSQTATVEPGKTKPYELHEPPQMETVVKATAEDETVPNDPSGAYMFSFSDGKGVEPLIKCLFRTLKESIHARPKRKPDQASTNKDNQDDVSPMSAESKNESSVVANADKLPGKMDSDAPQKGRVVTAASTPGRLIQNALLSSQTDEPAVLLIVDCLWQVAHFPCDVDLDSQFPKGLLQTHRRKLAMNGRDLTNIQLVFAMAGREWYRLLLTLSHADEGSKLLKHADLAEKCAFFFVLVVLHGMERGWKDSELTLEAPAVASFTITPRPNFRAYLGLTFLASLSASCFPDSIGILEEGKWSVDRSLQGADSKEGRLLQELLLARGSDVSKSLWRWASTLSEHKARRCSLLALECLSSCCVFSSFADFMYKLDPITKLASMLQLAVRDDATERTEFAVGFEDARAHTEMVKVGQPLLGEMSSVIFDWNVDKDAFKMAVLPADDEEEEHEELTLENGFPGSGVRSELGISPRPGGAEPVIEAGSALMRMMNRKGGPNDAAAMVAARTKVTPYVYPDVTLIRLILKTIANLLTAANSREVYPDAYRGEVGNWLQEVEVGPAGDASARVKLSRIAKKDQIVMFYFNMITKN